MEWFRVGETSKPIQFHPFLYPRVSNPSLDTSRDEEATAVVGRLKKLAVHSKNNIKYIL